jgi:hypothetical protein
VKALQELADCEFGWGFEFALLLTLYPQS